MIIDVARQPSNAYSTGCVIGEVTCPAPYLPEASSINFRRSVLYGFGYLATALRFRLARCGLPRSMLKRRLLRNARPDTREPAARSSFISKRSVRGSRLFDHDAIPNVPVSKRNTSGPRNNQRRDCNTVGRQLPP